MRRIAPAFGFCLAVAAPAAAQVAPGDGAAASTVPGPVPQTVPEERADGQDNGDGLADIIVTAQRREQQQQDVPIAIATVTPELAARLGATSTDSLTVAVPGLQFNRQAANGGAPYLRGVGTAQAAQGAESPVAVYIDDVYIGSPGATVFAFNNIASVEVLKGPQGTLFGRNATGGVVNVRTRRPSRDARVDASVGYANFDTVDANLYATTPVTDELAVNLAAVNHVQDRGYGRNALTGADVYKSRFWGVRGGALWEPSDDSSLYLIGDYSKSLSDQGLNPVVLPGTLTVGQRAFAGRYVAAASPSDRAQYIQYGVSARLDHDFGGIRLASITAYRRNRIDFRLDLDSAVPAIVALNSAGRNRTLSQELQLLAPEDSVFQWIAGLFYFDARAGFNPTSVSGLSQTASGGRFDLFATQRLKSYAGFGEVNYEVLPGLRLTAGLRYTEDRFDTNILQLTARGTATPPTPFRQAESFDKLTWRGVIDYRVSSDILVYGSASRGFKSGGYNLTAPFIVVAGVPTPAPPVSPEVLDAYEIGIKSEFLDNRLRINAAAFKYDYSDLQVTVVGTATSVTLNAASADIKGVDVDVEFVPLRGLTLVASGAVLDAEFASFPNAPFNVANPAVCTPAPQTTGPLTGGNRACAVDLTGERTPRAPTFTGSLAATYVLETDAGDFALTGSVYRNSGFNWDPDGRVKQPDYTLVGARLNWISPDRNYEVAIYGKNLTNAYYYDYASSSGTRDSGSPASPRTYGVTLTAHW